MKTIDEKEVIEFVTKCDASELLTIGFYSEPKTLKAYSNMKVRKYTEIQGYVGIDYSQLESVQKRNADPNYVPKSHNTDTTWIVDKKVQHNNKTGSTLLFFYPKQTDNNVISKCVLVDAIANETDISKDEMKTYCGSAGQSKTSLNEDGTVKYPEVMFIRTNQIYKLEK